MLWSLVIFRDEGQKPNLKHLALLDYNISVADDGWQVVLAKRSSTIVEIRNWLCDVEG